MLRSSSAPSRRLRFLTRGLDLPRVRKGVRRVKAARLCSKTQKLASACAASLSLLLAVGAGAASATTLRATAGAPDCGGGSGSGNLCVLAATASKALDVAGTSSLTVAGDIVVNSSSATAANASDASKVSAAAIGGPGGFTVSNGGSFSPSPVSAPAQTDPYAGASVAHDACTGGSSLSVLSGSQAANPGTYASLGAGGTGTLTLNPGVYAITGSFANTSGGTITGTDVTLYFCPGSGMSLSGSSTTNLSAPGGSHGFVIFSDTANTGSFPTGAVTASLARVGYGKSGSLQ